MITMMRVRYKELDEKYHLTVISLSALGVVGAIVGIATLNEKRKTLVLNGKITKVHLMWDLENREQWLKYTASLDKVPVEGS